MAAAVPEPLAPASQLVPVPPLDQLTAAAVLSTSRASLCTHPARRRRRCSKSVDKLAKRVSAIPGSRIPELAAS